MKVLFDTSVLVPAFIVNHPQHSVCFSQIKAAKSEPIQGFISTHSLAETYSVITRLPIQPRISPQQAEMIIVDMSQYLEGVPLLFNDYQAAIAQMATLNLPGGGIFDALIAQAALKAEVDALLTLNPNHFTRLGNAIAHIRPLARMQNLPSSPNPFSQFWEKGSQFQSPSPKLGRGI